MENKQQTLPEESGLSRLTLAVLAVVGFIFVASIFAVSYYSDKEAQQAKAQENKIIEKGIIVGFDKSDQVVTLGFDKIGKKTVYWAISEAGRALIFNEDWNVLGEADNPPVDLNKELPRSLTALAPLSGGDYFLGGTMDGKLNLYIVQNFRLTVKTELADFRNNQIGDPIAGAGSITHIFTNLQKTKAVVMNYDGSGRVYDIEGENLRETGLITLSAAAIDGSFVGRDEIWLVGADGRVYVYNINNPSKPGLDFNVSDFGRIVGADYRDGKFLIFGHSIEVKTASITIYDRTGKFEQILTQKAVAEAPADGKNYGQNPLDELPDISDLGDSFEDAKWFGAGQVLAVKNNNFYLLDLLAKKIQTFDLPLEAGEKAVRFVKTGKNTFVVGTSSGRVFETKMEMEN